MEENGFGTDAETNISNDAKGGQGSSWLRSLIPSGDSLLNNAVGVGRDLLQQLFYKRNRSAEQEYAKDMFDYEHQANIKDWQMVNEYNLPANQYARYIAAGMSPAAAMQAIAGVDGQAVAPNSTSQSPNSGGTGGTAGSLGMQSLLEYEALQKDIELKESQKNKNNAESDQIIKMTPEQVKKLRAEAEDAFSHVHLNEAQQQLFEQQTDRIVQLKPFEIQEKRESINKIVAEISEKKQAIANLKQQIEESKHRSAMYDSQTDLNYSQSQSEAWRTLQEQSKAFKADVSKKLVTELGINPDDPAVSQMLETALDDNKLVDYLGMLGNFCEGTGKYVKEHTSTTEKLAMSALIMEAFEKWHDGKVHRKLENMNDLADFLKFMMSFSGKSAVNPIGF